MCGSMARSLTTKPSASRNIRIQLLIKEAVAIGFEQELSRLDSPDCYFNSISRELLPKRDLLAKILREIGMEPIIPEAGYFMLADFSQFGLFL